MPTIDQIAQRRPTQQPRVVIDRFRPLPPPPLQSKPPALPPPPKPQPTQQPANPLQGVAAALGQVAGALQKAGQTIASGAQTVAREAGKFAAWTEQQQSELFSGKVTPATVIGTAASFILPTTIMQIAGGQKKLDIKNPDTAIGLGSDVLSLIPILGAVGKVVKGGAVAAKAATAATRLAEVARPAVKLAEAARPVAAPAVAQLVSTLTSLVSAPTLGFI